MKWEWIVCVCVCVLARTANIDENILYKINLEQLYIESTCLSAFIVKLLVLLPMFDAAVVVVTIVIIIVLNLFGSSIECHHFHLLMRLANCFYSIVLPGKPQLACRYHSACLLSDILAVFGTLFPAYFFPFFRCCCCYLPGSLVFVWILKLKNYCALLSAT